MAEAGTSIDPAQLPYWPDPACLPCFCPLLVLLLKFFLQKCFEQSDFIIYLWCELTRSLAVYLLTYVDDVTLYLTMDKLQLTGKNLARVFNYRNGRVHAMHLLCYRVKLPYLKLKTRPYQLIGSLPLDIMLTNLIHRHEVNRLLIIWLVTNLGNL